jgi:hypothetical protein
LGAHRLAAKPVPGKEFSQFCRWIAQFVRDKIAVARSNARLSGNGGEIRFKQMTQLAILGAM